MKLTAGLAFSQLKVNKRRTIWTLVGIILSSAMLTTIYGLGFGSGIDWISRLITDSPSRAIYNNFISGLAFIMSIFVLSISVIVISNAFRVSASERITQFGILKSVGATRKQITQTVMYEGIYLIMIAVPIGIIIGLIVQFVGVELINNIIDPMLSVEDRASGDYMFQFVFSPLAFIMSLGVSALTVFLSAWIPARKIANISAINAIRGTGEVQIKNKKIHGGKIVNIIFKFEGTLARVFLKRNKRNFRATVIAMSFSIAIFIMAGSFFHQMNLLTDLQWGGVEADVQVEVLLGNAQPIDCDELDDNGWSQSSYDEEGNFLLEECFVNINVEMSVEDFQEIHESLISILDDGDQIFGRGRQHLSNYNVYVHESELADQMPIILEEWGGTLDDRDGYHGFSIELFVVDNKTATRLAELAGVPVGSNILVNQSRHWLNDGRVTEHELINFTGQTLTLEPWGDDESTWEIELHGQLLSDQMPVELGHGWPSLLRIIVPELNFTHANWFIETDNHATVTVEGRDVLESFVSESEGRINVIDMVLARESERNIIGLVTLIVFGFVGMLISIGLTNVISTISENVKARAKEFAVLQSVGMTGDGIGRMLSLESVFSSFKSIFIGVPLGILGTFAIHTSIGAVGVFNFRLPWIWIVYSILGVFIITWTTMRVTARKLKKQNIIETIRSGSGV